jgi:hypothetical protein
MTEAALRAPAALVEYLLDAENGWTALTEEAAPLVTTSTVRLDSYVRFVRSFGHRKGSLSVDVVADGSVRLTHLGSRYWQVIFASNGNRHSSAKVPASVIVAAIRAAVEEG